MDELIEGVGDVDRTAALKALITWIDLGVLKEDEENAAHGFHGSNGGG